MPKAPVGAEISDLLLVALRKEFPEIFSLLLLACLCRGNDESVLVFFHIS